MPRTKEQNEEIKRITIAKIKNAGLRLFSVKGLADTSIIEIAQAAGISAGLMYHYYKSKEDLYAELVGESVSGANTVIRKIAELDTDPRNKVERLLHEILKQIEDDQYAAYHYVFMLQVMLNKSVPSQAKPFLHEAYLPFDIMNEIISNGQQTGDIKPGKPQALSTLFFSAITGLCAYKLMMKDLFVMPSVDMLSGILLNE
jgi:AcrR family transcriptional regulator